MFSYSNNSQRENDLNLCLRDHKLKIEWVTSSHCTNYTTYLRGGAFSSITFTFVLGTIYLLLKQRCIALLKKPKFRECGSELLFVAQEGFQGKAATLFRSKTQHKKQLIFF
jgi:hypothetical protein